MKYGFATEARWTFRFRSPSLKVCESFANENDGLLDNTDTAKTGNVKSTENWYIYVYLTTTLLQ